MTDTAEIEYALDGSPITPAETPAVVEEPVEFPEAEQQQLQQAGAALEMLTDLRYTISKRGVSQADIRSVFQIRASLEASGLGFDPVPSLEQYGTLSYTDERSSVNLKVATESIGSTIMQVIKTMIKHLIEYIQKMVRWFRQAFMGEKAVQLKLDSTLKTVTLLREKNKEFIQAYGKPRDFEKLSQDYHEEVLTKHGLKLTPITFALLGAHEQRKSLEAVLVQINEFLVVPPQVARTVTDFLSAKIEDDSVTIEPARLLPIARYFSVLELGDVDYPNAQKAIQDLGPAPLDIRLHPLLTGVTPYDNMVKTYEYINDTLKTIRNYPDVTEGDGLSEIVAELSKSVDTLAKVASKIYDINLRKINVLKLIYLYENMRFTLLFRYAKEQFIGGDKEERIDKFAEELKKLIKATMS